MFSVNSIKNFVFDKVDGYNADDDVE